MSKELWEAIVREYGTQCSTYKNEIEERLPQFMAALLYHGNVGDNPYCRLNKSFEELKQI